jgi:hypothetical protein
MRGLFWKKCSGLSSYLDSYCPNYYWTIHEAE